MQVGRHILVVQLDERLIQTGAVDESAQEVVGAVVVSNALPARVDEAGLGASHILLSLPAHGVIQIARNGDAVVGLYELVLRVVREVEGAVVREIAVVVVGIVTFRIKLQVFPRLFCILYSFLDTVPNL